MMFLKVRDAFILVIFAIIAALVWRIDTSMSRFEKKLGTVEGTVSFQMYESIEHWSDSFEIPKNIAYNIDFRGGIWHGGILEEIQVIGIDSLLPAQTSKNKIYINGIFKFNVGDEIWIIDNERNKYFSALGSDEKPMKYRINQIIEDVETDSTGLFLNYNLSTLGVVEPYASKTYSVAENPDLDLGLRVVSKFTDVTWKSGLWTNGIFSNGQYDSGIWYNGIFDGTWGN